MLDPRETMNTIQAHAISALVIILVEFKPVPVFRGNGTVTKTNLHS